MSDNLRDRIAKSMFMHAKPRTRIELSMDQCEALADAVIAELSLMIDDSYRISYGNAFIVHGYYEVRHGARRDGSALPGYGLSS